MNTPTSRNVPLPLTLNLIDATVVVNALSRLSDELADLRARLGGEGKHVRASALMTTDEVAQYLQVSRRTIARWVSIDAFPKGSRLVQSGSSRCRWRRADVEAWITEHDR